MILRIEARPRRDHARRRSAAAGRGTLRRRGGRLDPQNPEHGRSPGDL